MSYGADGSRDTSLILAQRLGEWIGHAPALEEDLALANIALDLLGQARYLLTYAAQIGRRGRSEDDLAFLRDPQDFLNLSARRAAERRFRPDDRASVPHRCVAARAVRALAAVQRAEARRARGEGHQGDALSLPFQLRLGRAPGRRHAKKVIGVCRRRSMRCGASRMKCSSRTRPSRKRRRGASLPIPRRWPPAGRAASMRC